VYAVRRIYKFPASPNNPARMKSNHLFLRTVISIGWFLILATPSLLQSTPLPYSPPAAPGTTFTVFFNGGSYVVATSNDLVGLQPNQVVDVAVQFSADKGGHTVTAEPLDGGRVIGPSNKLVVAADGTFRFKFQAGQDPGISQINLHDGAQETGLQFWVLNQQDPQENPLVINSSN
jgi:hypothetical protein